MKLVLQDTSEFDIISSPGPLVDVVKKWFKHLQHVDAPFRPWEYSGYVTARSVEQFVDDIESYAKKLNIDINKSLISTQSYLNSLHQIYEKSYDGQQAWNDYHEHIHILETKINDSIRFHKLEINYRHLSGLLNLPFQMEWLSSGTTHLNAGDVYLAWDELGKIPYRYWLDGEPDDLTRMCELAKPWLTVRPKIFVCLKEIDTMADADPRFDLWWQKYEKPWCAHYGIPKWSCRDSRSVLIIGKIQEWQNLENKLEQKIWPRRITL